MKLPFLVSVPHAGARVPPEVADFCVLTERQIIEDGDEGAAEIYDFPDSVKSFVTTDVARAIIDLNRAEDDRRRDGVVKTHTCWNAPVYRAPLPETLIELLLKNYYRPYHESLTKRSKSGVVVGIDCHTMAEFGPPVGPDPGQERPLICLSNADHTCPSDWLRLLASCFSDSFGARVFLNHPFKGGFIIRRHAAELPWIQVEVSRSSKMSTSTKRELLLEALFRFAGMVLTQKECAG